MKKEQTIEDQTVKLKELERMKMEFLNIVSHELKTPLTPMQAYLDLLLSERLGELTEKQKQGLDVISRNLQRLKHLITDLLEMARLETGQMKFNIQQIQLKNIILEAVKDAQTSADEKEIIIKSKVDSLPLVEGDKERLTQVFINLLNNAIKFTPEKGRITIQAKKQGYNFLIKISDTGIGIAEKNLNKIFDKFYQADSGTSRRFSGTGLGLTICKGIIEAHGGDIWVESEPKKGTIFSLALLYQSRGKPLEAFGEAFKIPGGGGIKKNRK